MFFLLFLEGTAAYAHLLLDAEEGLWSFGHLEGPLNFRCLGALCQYFLFRLGYPHAKFQNLVIFY